MRTALIAAMASCCATLCAALPANAGPYVQIGFGVIWQGVEPPVQRTLVDVVLTRTITTTGDAIAEVDTRAFFTVPPNEIGNGPFIRLEAFEGGTASATATLSGIVRYTNPSTTDEATFRAAYKLVGGPDPLATVTDSITESASISAFGQVFPVDASPETIEFLFCETREVTPPFGIGRCDYRTRHLGAGALYSQPITIGPGGVYDLPFELTVSASISKVPEPANVALLAMAISALCAARHFGPRAGRAPMRS